MRPNVVTVTRSGNVLGVIIIVPIMYWHCRVFFLNLKFKHFFFSAGLYGCLTNS